jgi:hypothetical protein
MLRQLRTSLPSGVIYRRVLWTVSPIVPHAVRN